MVDRCHEMTPEIRGLVCLRAEKRVGSNRSLRFVVDAAEEQAGAV